LQHIFHAPDKVGIGMRWDTPRVDDPWLDIIFFERSV
jgi:hypothetical protein